MRVEAGKDPILEEHVSISQEVFLPSLPSSHVELEWVMKATLVVSDGSECFGALTIGSEDLECSDEVCQARQP